MPGDTGIALTTSMLAPGDEQIVGERLRALLSAKRTLVVPAAAARAGGRHLGAVAAWRSRSSRATTTHVLQLRQQGATVEGSHQGDF